MVPAVPYRFETKEIALLSAGVVLKLKNNLTISLILYWSLLSLRYLVHFSFPVELVPVPVGAEYYNLAELRQVPGTIPKEVPTYHGTMVKYDTGKVSGGTLQG